MRGRARSRGAGPSTEHWHVEAAREADVAKDAIMAWHVPLSGKVVQCGAGVEAERGKGAGRGARGGEEEEASGHGRTGE